MRIGSLFSGYGGLDLAALQLFPDSELAWHCEYDAAPSKILAHHYPDVENHGDVRALMVLLQLNCPTVDQSIDILTGGYPCQPFSAAGQRKGTDDERHLWPYVRDAIRLLRPRFTLLENVAGHRSLGFDRVLGDLAEDGMHVRWTSLRASDVGAPHHRERIFILVTDASRSRPESIDGITRGSAACGSRDGESCGGDRGASPDADRGECDRNERTQGWQTLGRETTTGHRAGLSADSDSIGYEGCVTAHGPHPGRTGQTGQRRATSRGDREVSADAADDRRERCRETRTGRDGPAHSNLRIDWGTYGPAVRRWERLTRTAPAPTELNSNGRPRLNAGFAEWMMGLPAGHVTEVPGISRAHQLKAIGNGVCPQQAVAAYSSLLELVAS